MAGLHYVCVLMSVKQMAWFAHETAIRGVVRDLGGDQLSSLDLSIFCSLQMKSTPSLYTFIFVIKHVLPWEHKKQYCNLIGQWALIGSTVSF